MESYVTDDYEIVLGAPPHDSEGVGEEDVYKIRNKVTGVYEYSDYLLSRTVDTLVQMQERLDEVREKFFKADKPKLEVVDNGESSLH